MAWILLLHTAGIKILVFSLVLCTIIQISTCDSKDCHRLKTPGITIPNGDIIIEVGTPLKILCKLHDVYMQEHPNINSSNIIFSRNNEVVLEEWVTYVNESTAELYIENPPPSHSMYTCKLREAEEAICLNTVIVGTKPSDVKDFSCIGYNYQNFTCSWIEPEHYVKTTYNLTYYFQGRGSRSLFVCPNMTRHKDVGSCFWDISSRPHYRQSQPFYYFLLNIWNKFGNHTQNVTISHFANVIPEPPKNLRVVNKTTNSVTLTWSVKYPMNLFPPGVTYRIVYQSEYDEKDEWHMADTSSIKRSDMPVFNLTGLKYAHVLYDIRVSMRSSKARETDEKMWSKNVSLTVRTESALPAVPPKTNIGSFEIVNNKTNRDVYLYWQSIPEHMKNGENFSYKILSIEEDLERNIKIEKRVEPVEITNSYAKIVSINYKRNKFKIVSQNEVGHSVDSTTIIVPSLRERVKEPVSFTKILFGEQVYELSWVPPRSTDIKIKDYTIFFCRNDKDRPYQCRGYLNWTTVDSSTTVVNITVPDDKIYQFAISANTENSSSGMVWASCTVIHDKGFTKMKSLWIDSIGSNFIEVGWKLDCSDRIGSIEGFIIYYCPIVSPVDSTCSENERNITITGDPIASRGKITNLRPYTTYMLTVSVRSKHNNGLPSDPLYNTTLEAAPEPPENVTITNITSTSMVVQWLPPKAMNGILRYYEVRYWHNGVEIFKKPVDEKSTVLELKNLNTFTEYDITVYAYTAFRSKPSLSKTVKTSISVPGKMYSPNVKFQNETSILVGWNPPNQPGGNLDMYELQIKEKINSKNYSTFINTSELQWEVPNCGTDKRYKILYFSIRAINYDERLNKRYEGEWSDETENYCRDSPKIYYWLIIILVLCGLGVLGYVLKRGWYLCKKMRDVEVKLPPGLTPTITNDVSLNHWPVPNLQKSPNDDKLMHIRTDSSADEELLLAKKAECGETHDRITSGDSSGCSSGHESVTSSLASGTNLSSSSDSGTEQPRTPSSENTSRENSLRQRRTGSETLGWDSEIAWPNPKGYVLTMQLPDKSAVSSPSWTSNKPVSQSNYCVLGVDPTTPSVDTGIHGYIPLSVGVSQNEATHVKNPSYITCDSIFNKMSDGGPTQTLTRSPAYVKSSDAALMGRALTMPSQPQHGDKQATDVLSPTYVMAGGKDRSYVKSPGPNILSTGKLINIEPSHDLEIDSYMQHSSEIDKTANNTPTIVLDSLDYKSVGTTSPYVKTEDILNLKEPTKVTDDRSLVLTPDNVEEQQPSQLSSYCRLGLDRASSGAGSDSFGANSALQSPRNTVMEPNKGYVPHRQFENKLLKED